MLLCYFIHAGVAFLSAFVVSISSPPWHNSKFACSQTMRRVHPSVKTYHTKMVPEDAGGVTLSEYVKIIWILKFDFLFIDIFLGVKYLLTRYTEAYWESSIMFISKVAIIKL